MRSTAPFWALLLLPGLALGHRPGHNAGTVGADWSWPAPRALLQSDALSNSNGCITSGTIPKCEPGACATRNVQGSASWVCLRCLSNYAPVVDASGQDNIVQCVCPRGYYEAGPDATNCTRCDKNAWCPGGDAVPNPVSRGALNACGTNLTTRTSGSRSQIDCVAPAGFALTSPTGATACGTSEYAPMYNRLARCLRCQSGLAEDPAAGLTPPDRVNKKTVCKVPPGRYMSQGLVRWCPQGFYREAYRSYEDARAQYCLPCNPGITTAGPGAGNATECRVVQPGYGIANATAATLQALPTLAQVLGPLPSATLCDYAYYSLGGYCMQCPSGTVTRSQGAKAVEECAVPPGYIIASGSLVQCGNGTFRSDWLMFSDPRTAACSSCGVNMPSEPRSLDESPLAPAGSLVRASSDSCYIDAGQGMIAAGKNVYSVTDCPANTYGAAGKVYGWAAAPCKPCPRNMITDGATRVNDSNACINDDGFGYASEGASRCAPGYYALKGSRQPCQKCLSGRTTFYNATQQRLVTDCFVVPGFGVVSSTGATQDGSGFLVNTSSLTPDQAVALPVLECPVGYYGAGGALGSTCTKCPDGSLTEQPGATAITACTLCQPGYGQQGGNSTCTPCAYGTFNNYGSACMPCPTAAFYPPVAGAGEMWTSNGTTLFTGATSDAACVPQQSQLDPDSGQAFFSNTLLPLLAFSSPAATLASCLTQRAPNAACQLVQWDGTAPAGRCYMASLPWDAVGTTGLKLLYKLPPSTLGSASSIRRRRARTNSSSSTAPVLRAKMMGSGFFGRCDVPAAGQALWLQAGVALEPLAAQTFQFGVPGTWAVGQTETQCRTTCENSALCWAFFYNTTAQACLFRGGIDVLDARSFFVLPDVTLLVGGASPPGTGAGSLPAPSPAPVIIPSPSPMPPSPSPSPSPPLTPPNCTTGCMVPTGNISAIFTAAAPTANVTTCLATPCAAASPTCCIRQFASTAGAGFCRPSQLVNTNNNGNGNGFFVWYKLAVAGTTASTPTLISNTTFSIIPAGQTTAWASCKLDPSNVDLIVFNVGRALDTATATTVVPAPAWTPSSNNWKPADCQSRCGGSAGCWGFVYDVGNSLCAFRTGVTTDTWVTYLSR